MIKVTTNGGREDGWIRQPLKDIKEYKGHNTQKGSRGAERPHFGLMFIITTAVQHWYWWVRQNVCGCGCSGIPVLPERWWMTHDKHQYLTSIFRISCTSPIPSILSARPIHIPHRSPHGRINTCSNITTSKYIMHRLAATTSRAIIHTHASLVKPCPVSTTAAVQVRGLCRSFVTTDHRALITLGWTRTDTGCAGCRRVERKRLNVKDTNSQCPGPKPTDYLRPAQHRQHETGWPAVHSSIQLQYTYHM